MPKIDNLKGDELRGFVRRTRTLETQSPLGNSSVSRGALEITSPEGLIVKGSARIDGQLNGSGTINWSGPINETGNLTVSGGGKVKVGTAMTLDPSVSSGAIVFSNGAQVFTDATSIQIFKGGCAFTVTSTTVTMTTGSKTIVADSSGIRMFGLNTKSGTGLLAGLLWRDNSTGDIQRII